MTNLWIFVSICFCDDYTLQMFFKHKVRSSIILYNSSAYDNNSFLRLEWALGMKQHDESPHHRHGNCLCKGSFLLNHEFQTI